LFAEIVESTAFYRIHGDIDALEIVNTCPAAMKGLLPRHHGCLVKTLGDAVMFLFPDADSAVDAAVDMQRAITALYLGGRDMKVRIGLHAAPVVTGGDDVYGDTANVAAYLADAANPDQILISESTPRRHAAIRFERPQFYLVDHSINGTFISRENGEENHLMRYEMPFEDNGEIRPGAEVPPDAGQ